MTYLCQRLSGPELAVHVPGERDSPEISSVQEAALSAAEYLPYRTLLTRTSVKRPPDGVSCLLWIRGNVVGN